MKTQMKSILLIAIISLPGMPTTAQQRMMLHRNPDSNAPMSRQIHFNMDRGGNMFYMMGDMNLTAEQKEKIEAIRLKTQKEMLAIRNQLGEKQARLRTLTTGDTYNEREVNKVIEDIGALNTQKMKLHVGHRQEIRNLLDEQQRLKFDSRSHHMGMSGVTPLLRSIERENRR